MRSLAFTFVLLSSTAALAERSGVAVLDIQGTGVDPQLLPTLTEILTVEIDALGAYKVVAGRDVQAMLGFERQKDMLGCTDAACLAEIGGALGVDRIVVSHIGKVGSTFVVNIKLINIRKADTEARVYETVRGEVDALITTIRASVNKLFKPQASPATAAAPAPAPAKPAATKPAEQPKPVPKAEPQVAQAEQTPAVTAEVGKGGGIGTAPIVLWGIGLAAAGAGITFGIQAKAAERKANDPTFAGGQQQVDRAKSRAMAANVSYGVSVAALGAGVILFLMSGGKEEPATALVPMLGADGAGVALATRF